MRFSSRTWLVISLVLLLSAAWFAKLGNERRARSLGGGVGVAAPGVGGARKPGARLIHFPLLSASVASRNAAQTTVGAGLSSNGSVEAGLVRDEKYPFRIRNTSRTMQDLQHRESAILLRNALIDTEENRSVEVPEVLRAGEEPGSYVVQARGMVDEFFRAQVREVSGEVVAYIPNNAYLVRMSAAQAEALRGRTRVRSVLPFHPYYKLDYSLLGLALGTESQAGDEGISLKVGLFGNGAEETKNALISLGVAVSGEEQSPFGPIVRVEASVGQVAGIASLGGVQAIERSRDRVLMNDRTRVRMGISPDSTGLTNNYLGLNGTNVWVNVNDTGVDRTHVDLVGRVFGVDPAAVVDTDGHGTHVAGIIAGSGKASTNVVGIPSGSEVGGQLRGMAPGSRLFVMPVNLITGPLVSDAYLQRTAATTNYVVLKKTTPMISNNSWGYSGSKDYDLSSASYDAAVRDALPEMPGSQPMIYVFAAGNSGFGNDDGTGGEPDSLVSPATAKNVITVGALEGRRKITNEVVIPDPFDAKRSTTNQFFAAGTDSDDQVANFSSRGNVGIGVEGAFGRFKPDVVAPGSFVISTRSTGWVDPVNAKTPNVAKYVGQVVGAGAVNDYAVFLPDNIFGFELQLLPNPSSPIPFPALPVYMAYGRPSTTGDYLKDGSVVLPRDGVLGRGELRFSIGNRSAQSVAYDLVTILTTTNAVGDYFVQLRKLNDDLAPSYRYDSGSSAAAAAISGTLALMQQYFESNKVVYTPALMKALLINGARSVNSIYDLQVGNTINYQGWGQPRIERIIPEVMSTNLNQASSYYFVESGVTNALSTGESVTWGIELPPDAAKDFPLRATLVWTDPPGNPSSALKLVNDLDLIVSNSTTKEFFYGNFIPEGSDFVSPTPTGGTNELDYSDVVNNVENVAISEAFSANFEHFEVTVRAKRVNVNAVTAHPNGVVQDFALVVTCGGRPVKLVPRPRPAPVRSSVLFPTNGVPLLNQRVGANSPLQGGVRVPNNGVLSQWSFYVFTNVFSTNQPFSASLTNGQNVAFITFVPPNLSRPRNFDADVDLYVSRNPALTNLDAAAILAADKSLSRGGTETIAYTNAPVGADAIYYVGVKSEDQQGAEYGIVALSSDQPFESIDNQGNRILRGMPAPMELQDGSPTQPSGAYLFAIGITPTLVQRVVASVDIEHGNIGDLSGNLSHSRTFAVLNNHTSDGGFPGPVHSMIYDDSDSGGVVGSQPSDGPGSLRGFQGTLGTGVWILSMVDNQLDHVGRVSRFELLVEPSRLVDSGGVRASVLANRFSSFFVDVPADANELEVILSQITGPLNVYVRRETQPTVSEYDKFASFDPPGGTLSLTTRDVPPLVAGRYYIGVFNPGASTVDFTLRTRLNRGLSQALTKSPTDRNGRTVVDDVVQYATNIVDDPRPVTDVKVGVRIEHARLSDMALRLISPQGKSVLLMENRGGLETRDIGSESVATNFHHVAMVYDKTNGTALLYLDGEKVAEKQVGTFVPDTRDEVFIGRQPLTNNFAAPYVGLIDEVGIYNRALFGSEIRAIHRFGVAAKATNGLVANWSFEGNGSDLLGQSTLDLLGSSFQVGKEGFGLYLAQDAYARTTNQAKLNVGQSPGMTLEAWINPADLTTNRTLVLWSDGTNRVGTSFSIAPGATTAGLPGILTANFVGLDGTNRVVTMDTPGLIRTNAISTNYIFAVFNEDTNYAQIPIKFAVPPYVTNAVPTNLYLGGFELTVTNQNAVFTSGRLVDRWSVTSNEVNVLNLPTLAHTGTNVAALGRGSMTRTLPTVDGHRYQVSFTHRHQPEFDGVAAWWSGEGDTTDLIGFSPGNATAGLAYTNGVVGRGFHFEKPGVAVSIPSNPLLTLTNEVTVEFWFNRLTPQTVSGSLLTKSAPTNATSKARSNYGVDIHPTLGIGFWFDDPAVDSSPQSDDFGSTTAESLRVAALPSSGVFHHFVGTFKQTAAGSVEGRLYLDGKLAKTKQLPGSLANTISDAPVVLGSLSTNLAAYSVILDEPTIFARALSESEVQLIYTLGNLGKCRYPCNPETQIQIGGAEPTTFSSGSDWATNTYTFTARGSSTALELRPVSTGGMVDSFEMREIFAKDYLPEETLKDLVGSSGLGAWRLEMTDTRVGPDPTLPVSRLLAWQLQLTFAPTNYSAVTLTNGVTYSNVVAAGQSLFFIVEPPRSATRSTNSLSAGAALDLVFNQDGLPTEGAASGDLVLLTGQTQGASVISTNGTTQVDTNNVVLNATGLPKLQPGQRYYLGIKNPGVATPFSIRVDFDRVDPDVSGLTLLRTGVLLSTNIAVTNALQYYRYTVSTNAVTATFAVFPTNGNVNLYVRRASRSIAPLPTPNNYDYASENPGTEVDSITVGPDSAVPLAPGDWYLGVQNADTNRVNYGIRVTEDSSSGSSTNIVTLLDSIPRSSFTVPPAGISRLYVFTVATDPAKVLFELFDVSGSADLYVKRGSVPSLSDFDFSSQKAGLSEAQIVIARGDFGASLNGDWYLGVGSAAGGGVNYSIRAATSSGGLLVSGRPVRLAVSTSLSGNGALRMTWGSVKGENYRVESSTDLRTWTAIRTLTATGVTSEFEQAPTAGMEVLFYRIVQVP